MVQIRNPLTVVQQGGGGGGSDWLVIPEIGANDDNIVYVLLDIAKDTTVDIPVEFDITHTGTVTVEFGTTDSTGAFTPDSTLTVTTTSNQVSTTIPRAKFTYEVGNDKQILCKISSTTDITKLRFGYYNVALGAQSSAFVRQIVEIKAKMTKVTRIDTYYINYSLYFYRLKRFSLIGSNLITDFSSLFSHCYSLTSIPELDTSNGTNFQSMFSNCYSLTSVPELDTSNGTAFNNMFTGCVGLNSADFTQYDFSSATSTTAFTNFLNNMLGPVLIEFGDTFPVGGLAQTSLMVGMASSGAYLTVPIMVKINKTDAMLPIAANASTLFDGNYVYVYVPDALLATYQADTYWATLGTRLKGFSDLPS